MDNPSQISLQKVNAEMVEMAKEGGYVPRGKQNTYWDHPMAQKIGELEGQRAACTNRSERRTMSLHLRACRKKLHR